MAEFCKRCSILYYGGDTGDFANLCKPGEKVLVLCEGCGWIYVDHTGKVVEYIGLVEETE